jgi:hypothetical protein
MKWLLALLFTTSAFAQGIYYKPSLDFLKDADEYRDVQATVHQQLTREILDNISMARLDYNDIARHLRHNQPQIITQEIEFEEVKKNNKTFLKPKQIYFIWGYNRAFHSNSDMIFRTSEGNFTIHEAQGKDRPSDFDPKIYFNPTTFSIPQYVVKLGYMFNEDWGIELSQDHMKWVFVNDIKYKITGDFSPTLYVTEDGKEWPVGRNFDEIKESGNATWLGAEHSDGYNYVNVSAVRNLNVFKTKSEVIRLDIRPNAGFGLMVPKTKVMMHRDSLWSWKGLDNRFHVAGFGVHAELKARLTFFKYFFMEAAARVTYIKIHNSLVNGSNDRLEHTPITSLQLFGAAGVTVPIGNGKKKKKKKRY